MSRLGSLVRLTLQALAIATVMAGPVAAQQRLAPGAVPTTDQGSIREPSGFQRYAGSIIAGATRAAFDEMVLVTSRLERAADLRDSRNNAVFLPREVRKVEGRLTRLVYVLPEGRSPLEVIRGYQQTVREAGGSSLHECAEAECGGDTRSGAASGGGDTGLLQLSFPANEIPTVRGNPLECALAVNGSRAAQRFASLQRPGDAGFVSVLAYRLVDFVSGSECRNKGWEGRTIAVVTVLETAAREQRMETVKADAMGSSMARDGKVTFYAILFDTAKADIKPESAGQLEEMATYLKANPSQRVMIVGHTDNQGGVDYNADLSRRRAASVVQALVSRGIAANRLIPVGVGMAAPVTSNASEEGRARNRRVEMVGL